MNVDAGLARNTAAPAMRTPGSRSVSVSDRRAAHCEHTVTRPEVRTAASIVGATIELPQDVAVVLVRDDDAQLHLTMEKRGD